MGWDNMKRQALMEEKKFFWAPESPEEHELVFYLRNKEKISFGLQTFLGGIAIGLIIGAALIISALV